MPLSRHFSRSKKGPRRNEHKRKGPVSQATNFLASRVGQVEDDSEPYIDLDEEIVPDERIDFEEEVRSSSEDERHVAAQSYALLLRTFKPKAASDERPFKRRKLDKFNKAFDNEKDDLFNSHDEATTDDARHFDADLTEDIDEIDQIESDDESLAIHDPFDQRFANIPETDLAMSIDSQSQKPSMHKQIVGKDIRKIDTTGGGPAQKIAKLKSRKDIILKKRLLSIGTTILDRLTSEELDIAYEMYGYRDILCGFRTYQNANNLRNLTSLHILNHILKTRDRVLKNNSKLVQDPSSEAEYRDQGFTRPKVLVLLPTKQSCVHWIESLTTLSEPDQQENRSRFLENYSLPNDDMFDDKPEDFKELFTGNHEEDFRIGLKFTRKTIKFFSGFYNSDIIFASPLGLMRTIKSGSGSSKDESKKGYDADFLSSIEMCVIDQATALEQQNWSHVDYVLSQLNQLPRESHGCDFARIRHFYLNDQSKYLRQVLVFAAYITPSIQSLTTTHMHNISGRVKYTPTHTGAMLDLSPSMPITIAQTFQRFDSPSPHTDNDTRFKYFTTTILAHLLRQSSSSSSRSSSNRGTLIFVPTYLDFVRLRNHFSTAAETSTLSFGTISEYSSRGEVARTRAHFRSGKHAVLLYSERAHHYFRYRLKGVRRLVFYGVPENPAFWTEMIAMLGVNAVNDLAWAQSLRGKQGRGLVRALFSKWDYLKLERVVGTDRVGRLISDGQGDVFEFL